MQQVVSSPLRTFSVLLFIFEAVILLFFGVFVRMETNLAGDTLRSERYMAFQDVNVMILVGFGLLYTFIKTYSLSSLIYTFLANAIAMQLYVLFSDFWTKVIVGFANTNYYIPIQQQTITKSSYCAASVLIALGAFIGRVGPKEMLVAAVLQTIGYSFNEVMNYQKIQIFDAGGTTVIHIFGAYFGLGVSWILSSKAKPGQRPTSGRWSNVLAMVGTLFLWIYWPSFNFGVEAQSFYEQNQIVANTLYSLTGSCLATFILTSFMGRKFEMDDILNATLAGGVVIGASSGFLYQPAVAIAMGIVGGFTTTLGFHSLSNFLENRLGLHDTCGINNLHGLPGIVGGIFSAIIIASYQNGFDPKVSAVFSRINNPFTNVHGTFLKQGGLQIAGTFTSLGFGLLFGVLTGLILRRFYNESPNTFYQDSTYIQIGDADVTDGQSSKSNLDGKSSKSNLEAHDDANRKLIE